ncbi:MAG: TonB-dependent receptor [Acidobacteria bacterium]|nr:TonB-dependent receptor [Acidobacteriota bacterium]
MAPDFRAAWVVSIIAVLAATLVSVPAASAVRQSADRHTVSGIVVDTSGAPVPAASIRIEPAPAGAVDVKAGSDGTFAAAGLPQGAYVLRAAALGFADAIESVLIGPADVAGVRVVLHPAGFAEAVSVTASRGTQALRDPSSVSVLTSSQISNAAAGAIDDVLRATPGFSLFRRTSSRVANPTTQGVTLRGLSSSGASRTVVLADGVPLNDAFGGWVYWDRVPVAAIERIEVVRGAAGDLYGADALGGVVQMLTFGGDRPRVRVSVDGGSRGTVRGSLFAGGRRRGWTAAGAAEWFQTDGAPVVAPEERGPVDVPATSRSSSQFLALGYAADTWHADLRASVQTEKRGNGTPLQRNDTSWHQFAASAAGSAGGGLWTVQAGGGAQSYFQTFSSISASRDVERLTSDQRIPTTFMNGSAQWIRPFGRQSLIVGAEGHRTNAEVRETRYSVSGVATGPIITGGDEDAGAVYARVNLAIRSSVSLNAGMRVDLWRPASRDMTPQRDGANFLSPRVSVAWRPKDPLAVHGMAYGGHRTPTLNELYRGFRAGNTLTNANPLLTPEHFVGVEGGLLLSRRSSSLRVTGFSTRLSDAVTNVTIQSSATLTVRERQNTDTVRASGLEIEAELRPHPTLTVAGLAVLTASRFVKTPAQPAIAGNLIPQVPRYQFGASVTWVEPRWVTLTAAARMSGAQFEDDMNTLELRRFVVVDMSATREVVRRLQVFGAVENLFDTGYDTGRTPTRTIGWPRTVRVGIRFYLP